MSERIAHFLLDILGKQSVSAVMEADTLVGSKPGLRVLPRQRRSASAGLRWCSAMVRCDHERNGDGQEQSSRKPSATGHAEPVEGQAGQTRRSSDHAEVEASGGAGAVEPAEWHDRSASIDSTDALFAKNVERKIEQSSSPHDHSWIA